MRQGAKDREMMETGRAEEDNLSNENFADAASEQIKMPSDVVNLSDGNLGGSEVLVYGCR
jgi:hypothetical protein